MTELLGATAPYWKLLHALLGIFFVCGLVGRWFVLERAERAARAGELRSVQVLLDAAGIFERIVVVVSLIVFVLGLVTAWAMGYPLLGFLEGARINWVLAALVLFLSAFALVPTVFVPKGRQFSAALAESVDQGRPTAALVAAFADPAVRAGHIYEMAAVVGVLVLMIAKPF